jgi:DNA mismatch repair protein MutS
MEEWLYTLDYATESLNKHFKTKSLKGFGIENLPLGTIAAGAALFYLSENQHKSLGHINTLGRIEERNYVWLDRFTIRNLELVYSPHDNAKTLLDVLDKTVSPMGGRLMHRWLILPLKDAGEIRHRHSIVKWLKNNPDQMDELGGILKDIGDLERLIAKVAVGKINPRELAHLKRTMIRIPLIKNILEKNKTEKELVHIINKLNGCEELVAKINDILADEPAVQIGKGPIIKEGFDGELDELRAISGSGKDYLDQLQDRESLRTGISSLKISFNNVFGYYIEVRNTHKDKVPEEWIRRQTLVNAERYITEELKTYETKILGAEEKIYAIEARLFTELVQYLSAYIIPIQQNAAVIAKIDCLYSFATVASKHNYIQPEINDSFAINIHNGRHPVIEQQLKHEEDYIANDVFLDNETQQLIMITGPNMSGKSALLRQTALIVLMAQMGSFVPADLAEIGIVDKVFTRVGASDNISSGESTFMVEMNETASILNNISPRSLIILDEIGRGTSTYDGISIAWSIAEYLHENKIAHCKTLFATHYHELNEMTNHFTRIKNYTISVKEIGNSILFLRKLIPGGSEHSFGIHVARMAGMPNAVIKRAEEVLSDLEKTHAQVGEKQSGTGGKNKKNEMQLSFFQLNDPVLEQIHEQLIQIDINTLTPVEALMKLHEIKKLTGG